MQRFELMNTAVMTGKQVSQSMKIFVVSESGSVADVTLHTSCSTTDAAALKVSTVPHPCYDKILQIAFNFRVKRSI